MMDRISLELTSFSGVTPKERISVPVILPDGYAAGVDTLASESALLRQPACQPPWRMALGNSAWEVTCSWAMAEENSGILDGSVCFRVVSGTLDNANVSVRLDLSGWSDEHYVMMPAAVYSGNRFKVANKHYPPFLHKEDGIGPDMPVTITDVPHLALGEGDSRIHLRSGDMATPCICLCDPQGRDGFILQGEPDTEFGYTGWMLEESPDRSTAFIRMEAPAVRKTMYQMCDSSVPSDDCGANFTQGDVLSLHFRIYRFPCGDIPALFAKYLEVREDLSGKPVLHHDLPLSAAFRLIEDKFNKGQWNARFGYYMASMDGEGTRFGDWQAGWCGNGMHTLAFLTDGQPLSQERSRLTWDAVFGILQHENGWISPIFSGGNELGDDFCHQSDTRVMLIRKNADLLLFAGRHIALLQQRKEVVPLAWMSGFGKLADAFVRLWNKNGQFGQFINMDRDEILQGGTASGGIAPGGLALAWKLTENPVYLETAIASARHYFENYVLKGLMNGGPGEILQNPDSESSFGLLESLVELYEVTGNREWLPMAEACACQCASWCVSYDFSFPPDSVFGRLGMRTSGSVYANAQNKHSAPGICTLSGVSLLKLYRATGNRVWLELLQAIAHNITQYLSRPDRLIPTWDSDGGTEPPDGAGQGNLLPAGCMCERVNMCDWETKKNIGGIFNGGCWCETSALLTYSEVPGVWVLTDTGEVHVFDHVEAEWEVAGQFQVLSIRNPTRYDAEIKIRIESTMDLENPMGPWSGKDSRTVFLAAGDTVKLHARSMLKHL